MSKYARLAQDGKMKETVSAIRTTIIKNIEEFALEINCLRFPWGWI